MSNHTFDAPSAIWPASRPAASGKARLRPPWARATATIASTASEARYMNRRWVRWMSTSREVPNGMNCPRQPGNCWPQAMWAPATGASGVPMRSVPAT